MRTILHIDSSEFYRKVLHLLFVENGYNYLEAGNTKDAIDIIEHNKIDIIFTAVEFATQDSSAFIKRLNSSDLKNIPIYVISSNDNVEKRKEFFTHGIIDYILKSTSPEDIVKYVENFGKKDKLIEKMETLSIAVVDDSQLVLNMIKKIFDIHYLNCVEYMTDESQLFIEKKAYDLYIVDFILQNSTGEKIVRKIREYNKDAIIIIISSIQNSKTIANTLSSGADDFILKPFNTDVFMARLKTNVRSYLLMKELELKNIELNILKDKINNLSES